MSDESSTESVRDEFQDPLENYEPKSYDDPLEEALAESTVEAITHQPCATIASGTTVREALDMLSGLHVACLLVEEDGGLVGVFRIVTSWTRSRSSMTWSRIGQLATS